MGLKAGLDVMEKTKICYFHRESNTKSSVLQSKVQPLYSLNKVFPGATETTTKSRRIAGVRTKDLLERYHYTDLLDRSQCRATIRRG